MAAVYKWNPGTQKAGADESWEQGHLGDYLARLSFFFFFKGPHL